MLTADLVNARRRSGELRLVTFDDDGRTAACALAEQLLSATSTHVGRTRDDLAFAVAAIDVGPRDHRLKDGLAKLIEDRCEWGASDALDPEAIRTAVFTRASTARSALPAGVHLDRSLVLADVARDHATSPEAIEDALFADLRGAHVLLAFEAPSAEALVSAYERAQAQAVLLRAVKVTAFVRCASSGAVRAFFRQLKFLRLLHTIAKDDDVYKIVIDGPFSLFESVTKYGLQLALVLPALEECDSWRLEADVRWGKERAPLVFRLRGSAALSSRASDAKGTQSKLRLPDEIATLVRSFKALATTWKVSASASILELPGVGLTVPDLVFERTPAGKARERIYLEVMGYWSRAAVWQRVELVQAGLAESILFAVSTRLRVSEEVLDGDLPGALYVYKGTMSARVIADRLEALSARSAARSPMRRGVAP